MNCTAEIHSNGMTYKPSFMKIGKGTGGKLGFYLRNWNGCIVRVTGESDLISAPLK
jgi:hypothetical protein